MIRNPLAVILLFCTSTTAFSQNNDYFSLKDVKTFRFEHLELKNERDILAFIAHAGDYNFIEALKIDDTRHLNQVIASINGFYSLKELNLAAYMGDLNEHTFDSCGEIEVLHLSLREEKIEQLRHINSCKKLNTLYLYIKGKPENLEPLKGLPQLNELHIIGDLLPKDLALAVENLRTQSSLYVLGLSVDRITDLPPNITRYKRLGKLMLYDNLSVYTNNGIDELSEEKLSIVFSISNDLMSSIAISYLSNSGKLSEFEIEYLQQLYHGEIFQQQLSEEETVSENEINIPFKKEFLPDFRKTQEFNPPYPSIMPSSEIFIINPASSSVIYSGTGLKVTIPANCFINPAGEQVTDPVYIKITQITQPSEILFAGLNLKNGHQQLTNQFLFNIEATTVRSAATLKEGYQLKVLMPVGADSAASYFFDYESGTWQNLNFYNEVFANNFVPTDFYKIESPNQHIPYYQFDTASFNSRFHGPHHYFLNDKYNSSELLFRKKSFYTDLDRPWAKDYNKSGKLTGIKIKNGKAYVKIQKVIPKVRNKERQYFKILDKTEQQIIPELKPLKGINFNVKTNPENKKEFNENFVRNAKYLDVRIQYSPGKDYCEIMLKTSEGYRKLVANITDSEDKDVIRSQIKKFQKAYAQYLKIRARRSTEFNSLNMLRYEEYKTFSSDKIKILEKNRQLTEIKVHQLGTFGLMYSRETVFSTNLIAQYTDISGLPIDVKDLFLVDSRYNTVIRIQPGNISFDPATTQYIIATDYSGNLYYANKSDIQASNLSNNALTYIKLKKVSHGLNSVAFFNNMVKN
jgi:hypothetical protein